MKSISTASRSTLNPKHSTQIKLFVKRLTPNRYYIELPDMKIAGHYFKCQHCDWKLHWFQNPHDLPLGRAVREALAKLIITPIDPRGTYIEVTL